MHQERRLHAEVSPLIAVISLCLRTSSESKPRAPLITGRRPAQGSEHRLDQRDGVENGLWALRLGASDFTRLLVQSSLFVGVMGLHVPIVGTSPRSHVPNRAVVWKGCRHLSELASR